MPYEAPSYFVPPPVKGLRMDLPVELVPEDAASVMENFIRRQGKIQCRPGFEVYLGDTGTRVAAFMSYVHSGGGEKLVAATDYTWLVWNVASQTWTDLFSYDLNTADDDFQSFRIFYKSGTSYLVGVNGQGAAPTKWDGSAGTFSAVGGSPSKARCLAVLANRMLLGNLTSAPLTVDVSAFNDFESGWGSTQTAVLADTPGHIVEIREMGALVAAIYKTDSWYTCTAAPGTYPFSFTLKQAEISGPMSTKSVVSTPIGHYILARDCNVYKCDGASYAALGEHIRAYVSSDININRMHRSWGFYDKANNEVWFFWPGDEAYYLWPNHGMILKLSDNSVWPVKFDMDYMQPTAGIQTLLETASTLGSLTQPLSTYTSPLGSYNTRQSLLLLGCHDGDVYAQNGYLDTGVDKVSYAYESGFVAPSKERKFYTVTQLEVYFKPSSGVAVVSLRSSDQSYENEEAGGGVFYLNDRSPHIVGCRRDGRFFRLYVAGLGSDITQYEGTRVSGVERGRR